MKKSKQKKSGIAYVRSHLPIQWATFSKVLHYPAINFFSRGLAASLGNTHALIGAGVFCLTGSALMYGMAQKYGLPYQPTIAVLLLGIGFVVGLLYSLLVSLIRKKK